MQLRKESMPRNGQCADESLGGSDSHTGRMGGASVCYAASSLRLPWFSLCFSHFRNICLSENGLYTLPLNFKLFFLNLNSSQRYLKRGKSSDVTFFSLLQAQWMKRLKRSLQVNSEM